MPWETLGTSLRTSLLATLIPTEFSGSLSSKQHSRADFRFRLSTRQRGVGHFRIWSPGLLAPCLKNLDICASHWKIRIPPEKCVKKQKPKKRPTNWKIRIPHEKCEKKAKTLENRNTHIRCQKRPRVKWNKITSNSSPRSGCFSTRGPRACMCWFLYILIGGKEKMHLLESVRRNPRKNPCKHLGAFVHHSIHKTQL